MYSWVSGEKRRERMLRSGAMDGAGVVEEDAGVL